MQGCVTRKSNLGPDLHKGCALTDSAILTPNCYRNIKDFTKKANVIVTLFLLASGLSSLLAFEYFESTD